MHQPRATRRIPGTPPAMQIGYFLSCEEFAPARPRRPGPARRGRPASTRCGSPTTTTRGTTSRATAPSCGRSSARSRRPPTCRSRRASPARRCASTRRSSPRPRRRARVLLDGRFNLGVGSGEALNEHILGDRWPEADVRLEMLEEAVEVIRTLWQGGQRSHHGPHYTVENARVYDLPDEPPPHPRLRLRPQGDRARGAHRRRLLHDLARQGGDRPLPLRGRQGPGPRRDQGLLHGRRGRGARPPRTACGPTRRCRASWRRSCPTPAHFEQACELVEPEMLVTPVGPDLDAARGVAAPVRRRGRRRALRPADRPRAGRVLRHVGARGPSALRLTLARNPRFDRRAIR